MFEYVTLTVDWDHLQDVLNAQGSRGWHVVHMTSPRGNEYRVVLERQTPIQFKTGGVIPNPNQSAKLGGGEQVRWPGQALT